MSNKNIIVLVIAILVVGAGVYFISNQNSGSTTSTPVTNPANNGTTPSTTSVPNITPVPVLNQVIHNISITGFAFVPATITVRKGETIVWTNKDTVTHNIIGGDLQSNPLAQNDTYSFTYDKTGTFSYHCSIHPSMKGTIIVTN